MSANHRESIEKRKIDRPIPVRESSKKKREDSDPSRQRKESGQPSSTPGEKGECHQQKKKKSGELYRTQKIERLCSNMASPRIRYQVKKG